MTTITANTTSLDRTALQRGRIREGAGFIAALDQSGGSTPRALAAYGIDESGWSDEAEMFDLVHAMRTRLITSRAFASGGIIGAILFEQTLEREVDGRPTADYLWETRGIVPFVKCAPATEVRRFVAGLAMQIQQRLDAVEKAIEERIDAAIPDVHREIL